MLRRKSTCWVVALSFLLGLTGPMVAGCNKQRKLTKEEEQKFEDPGSVMGGMSKVKAPTGPTTGSKKK